jgi:hypothetical protein
VNLEIILRDFLGDILRPLVTPTAAGMQISECEHLNPRLFEASDHAIWGPAIIGTPSTAD